MVVSVTDFTLVLYMLSIPKKAWNTLHYVFVVKDKICRKNSVHFTVIILP